jgi:hypothetical protein
VPLGCAPLLLASRSSRCKWTKVSCGTFVKTSWDAMGMDGPSGKNGAWCSGGDVLVVQHLTTSHRVVPSAIVTLAAVERWVWKVNSVGRP